MHSGDQLFRPPCVAAALRTVTEGQQQMATGVLARHEQEAAALSGMAAAAKRGAEQADGEPARHWRGLSLPGSRDGMKMITVTRAPFAPEEQRSELLTQSHTGGVQGFGATNTDIDWPASSTSK